MPRCGTIVLAGRPNTGKSTLLNALIGERLAIVSAKPQTPRLPVVGVRTEEDAQLVFVDPPGLLKPRYLLHEAMLEKATVALRQADAILRLHPADEEPWPATPREGSPVALPERPTLLVLTKADLLARPRSSLLAPDRRLVSAQTGQGIPELLAWCRAHLPESPFCYDPEYSSTQPLRFFAAEFVREAAFAQLGDELPYALAVEVDEFREHSEPVYIRAIIFVERDSQKAMVIGKDGRMIKSLGAEARSAIEGFLGARVYLDLWVKVLPKWRSRADALQRFGFSVPTSRHA